MADAREVAGGGDKDGGAGDGAEGFEVGEGTIADRAGGFEVRENGDGAGVVGWKVGVAFGAEDAGRVVGGLDAEAVAGGVEGGAG